MPSRDFAVRVYGERLTPDQRVALGVLACLLLYAAARADAKSHTVFVNLAEFAPWAGCSYSAARQAWDRLEALGIVVDVKRRPHGFIATLGEMFQRSEADELTVAVKVYERVFRRRPHSLERQQISQVIGTDAGDLKLWRLVCEQWQHGRHNAADTTALLEVFGRKREAARKVLVPKRGGEGEQGSGGAEEPPGLRD